MSGGEQIKDEAKEFINRYDLYCQIMQVILYIFGLLTYYSLGGTFTPTILIFVVAVFQTSLRVCFSTRSGLAKPGRLRFTVKIIFAALKLVIMYFLIDQTITGACDATMTLLMALH